MVWKEIGFFFPKIIKFAFLLLLIVLMILWIVLSVDTTRQIGEIHIKHGRIPLDNSRFGARNYLRKSTMTRLYQVTIFNTVLEEIIAFLAIICLLIHKMKLFSITIILLIIIWFIEQFRISDFSHQIDLIDLQNSQLILATHIIHFLAIILGIILIITDQGVVEHLSGEQVFTTNMQPKVFLSFPTKVASQTSSGDEPAPDCCSNCTQAVFGKVWTILSNRVYDRASEVQIIPSKDVESNRPENIVPIGPPSVVSTTTTTKSHP